MTTLRAAPSEVATSDDLARLAADLGRAANSTATRSAYAGDFKRFSAWCRQEGHTAVPTTPAIVGLYVAALFDRKPIVAIGTIERAIAGIAYQHRLAGHHLDRQHPAIADVLKGAKRTRKRPPRQARPVISDELRRILEICGDDHGGRRNRAMLLVAFYGALRGAELVGIELHHLTESPAGYRLLIPSSKGDQEGEGQFVGLPRQDEPGLCPVRAMKAWLAGADIDKGPVFVRLNKRRLPEIYGKPLTDRAWRLIIKDLANRAGFSPEDVAEISGHSLRAGHITTGYMKEVPEWALQKQARHVDVRTTRRYNRQATVFVGNSAKGLMD